MKSYILLLALTFSCFGVQAENDSLFDYDQDAVVSALEERYGSVAGSVISFDSDTVWVSNGKRACGFFIKGTNWGVFSRGGKQVILGWDSAAINRQPTLRFLRCYRYR